MRAAWAGLFAGHPTRHRHPALGHTGVLHRGISARGHAPQRFFPALLPAPGHGLHPQPGRLPVLPRRAAGWGFSASPRVGAARRQRQGEPRPRRANRRAVPSTWHRNHPDQRPGLQPLPRFDHLAPRRGWLKPSPDSISACLGYTADAVWPLQPRRLREVRWPGGG